MNHSVINRIEGQHEITTSFTIFKYFHTKRHLEIEFFFLPSHMLAPRNKPVSKHSHLHAGVKKTHKKTPVNNYAASILNVTIIRGTCTSESPLSDFAGRMNNSAYVWGWGWGVGGGGWVEGGVGRVVGWCWALRPSVSPPRQGQWGLLLGDAKAARYLRRGVPTSCATADVRDNEALCLAEERGHFLRELTGLYWHLGRWRKTRCTAGS